MKKKFTFAAIFFINILVLVLKIYTYLTCSSIYLKIFIYTKTTKKTHTKEDSV